MERLFIEDERILLTFNPIDIDNEMEVSMMDKDGNTLGLIFLSVQNLESIQKYISAQLNHLKKR